MIYALAAPALILLYFAIRYFNRADDVKRWRKQLKKNDRVRFYYKAVFLTGKIKDFYEGGETASIRLDDGKYFMIPVNNLVQPTGKKLSKLRSGATSTATEEHLHAR